MNEYQHSLKIQHVQHELEAEPTERSSTRQMTAYKDRVKWDNQNALDFAEETGIEQGMYEKAVEIATNLKKEGLSIELIAKTTGLSAEEIEKL